MKYTIRIVTWEREIIDVATNGETRKNAMRLYRKTLRACKYSEEDVYTAFIGNSDCTEVVQAIAFETRAKQFVTERRVA